MKLLAILVLAACGGSQRAEPPKPEPVSAPAPEPTLDQRMNDYASVMQRFWPAKPSPRVTKEVCDLIGTITQDGRALGTAFRSQPNVGIETTGAALQIEASVDALERACAEANQTAFESALSSTQRAYEKAAAMYKP